MSADCVWTAKIGAERPVEKEEACVARGVATNVAVAMNIVAKSFIMSIPLLL